MVPCHLTRIHHRESRSGVTWRDVTIRSPVTVWNGDCTVWLSIFCGGSVSIPFYRFLWIGIRSMQQTADAFLSWARHGNQGPYYTARTTPYGPTNPLHRRQKEITQQVCASKLSTQCIVPGSTSSNCMGRVPAIDSSIKSCIPSSFPVVGHPAIPGPRSH